MHSEGQPGIGTYWVHYLTAYKGSASSSSPQQAGLQCAGIKLTRLCLSGRRGNGMSWILVKRGPVCLHQVDS